MESKKVWFSLTNARYKLFYSPRSVVIPAKAEPEAGTSSLTANLGGNLVADRKFPQNRSSRMPPSYQSLFCHSCAGAAGSRNLFCHPRKEPAPAEAGAKPEAGTFTLQYRIYWAHVPAAVPNLLRARSHVSTKAFESSSSLQIKALNYFSGVNFPNSSVASSWIFEKAIHLYQKQTCMHRKSARHKKFLSLVAG
jgi:hypothetical protein